MCNECKVFLVVLVMVYCVISLWPCFWTCNTCSLRCTCHPTRQQQRPKWPNLGYRIVHVMNWGVCILKLTFLFLQEHNDWIVGNQDFYYFPAIILQHIPTLSLCYIMQQCLVLKTDVEISDLSFIKNKLASKIWFVIRIEFLKISEVSANIFIPFYTMYLCKTKLSALIL